MLALTVTLLLATAPAIPPHTTKEVQRENASEAKDKRWSKTKSKRKLERALLRFAKDQRATAKERGRAARALTTLRAKSKRHPDGFLLEARLSGLQNLERSRKVQLRKALALLTKLKKSRRKVLRKRVATALEDDALYLRFSAKQKKAIGAGEQEDARTLQRSVARYIKLGDRERALKVALVLARRKSFAPDLDESEKAKLYDLTSIAPKGRDAALLRLRALRQRATFLEAAGAIDSALTSHFRADRVDTRPPKRAAFDAAPEPSRSLATSRLCFAASSRGIDCAKNEKKNFGQRTFYNFTGNGSSRDQPFDFEITAWVLSEYQSLLHACLEQSAKANEAYGSIELHWGIAPSGRVTAIDLRPRRLRKGKLHQCLKDAFAKFRYPAYAGEMQHISLGFDLSG